MLALKVEAAHPGPQSRGGYNCRGGCGGCSKYRGGYNQYVPPESAAPVAQTAQVAPTTPVSPVVRKVPIALLLVTLAPPSVLQIIRRHHSDHALSTPSSEASD